MGEKGGAYAIRSLLLLSWKEKKNQRAKKKKKWWSFGCAPPQTSCCQERDHAQGQQPGPASLFVRTQQTKAQPSTQPPMFNNGKIFCARTDALLFAAHRKKGFAKKKKTRHDHDHDHNHVSSKKKFVLQMFFNYHKTSEPNNNK